MGIRKIDKYQVVNRFSLGKCMYDTSDYIYIQEHDPIHGEPQKVFSASKEYVTDISSEIYLSLCQGFVVLIDE
ncbi:hypothetical protein [Flagellimonas zhangzhouensis]|uniref:Uncharacterized protein n=1 Tax=Flagellimonas zhangzhouensis TaxID=1073328 RepID=A0A1H2U5P9_9FLAO|nr:hypothetical protein [Allomuricauda zhangzhouensis]SDQ20519.1 hypothetical protein SAMN05216294_0859 [Allomuricauda zhangzhouensis]SDW50824.1 hypothetical protein SAMN04487892_1435 [Allomuricauda zhangzhouensis]